MSFEDRTLQNFIQLVETQWTLFANHQGELDALLESLPSDKAEMSDAIYEWCESRPDILKAMDALWERQESDRTPGTQGTAPPPPDPEFYQKMLQNAIRRNQSPPNPKS
jgi:hypothetical protein